MACWILVPQPGIEPVLLAVEAWNLNHWTTREVLDQWILMQPSVKSFPYWHQYLRNYYFLSLDEVSKKNTQIAKRAIKLSFLWSLIIFIYFN